MIRQTGVMADLCVVDVSTVQLASSTRLQLTKAYCTRILLLFKHLVAKDAARATTHNAASNSAPSCRDHPSTLASHSIISFKQDLTEKT